MSSNVEQKIGKYEVLSKIGEGGMGVVYKAKDPLIDRTVAIKMMTGAFAEETEARERFLREARAVGRLQHPNIVTIYELGVEGNAPYMVMEFLEGQGLDKVLANRVALTMVQKLEYMEQICSALHYAHERDIVHRDVKPANVIVMKGGSQVKLVDFGIARAGSSGMTRTGFAIGTTSYMSPEQIEASKTLDRRSDVFSAGVMMYEVLTNNLPFPGTEPIAIAIKILREPFPRLAAYLAEYPAELDDIMNRALAKDRDERYSTAEEMAFDLSRLIEHLKRNMVSDYVVQGRESFSKKDFGKAKELISYVLKIDPGNSEARQLNYEIQKMAQVAQKGEHLKQLKAAIEETIGQRQYDEALNFIEQALKIDTQSAELQKQKDLVLAEQARRAEVKKRLNLAQSAEANGDFRLAREHVEKALSLDPTDTQARIVKGNIEQAIAEQDKQKQIRELLDTVKGEMADRRFTAAREAIKRAEGLQPDSPEIQALKAAVYSGHEQELKRRELEQTVKEIQGLLAAEDADSALKKVNAALQDYPGEVTLVQLRTAAEQQRAGTSRKKKVDDQIAKATRLINDNKAAEALKLIQAACQEYPEEERLQKFVVTAREAAEREETDRLKNEYLKKAKDLLARKNYESAISTLEGARIEIPSSTEIADLLHHARDLQRGMESAKIAAEKAAAAELAAAAKAAEVAAEKAAKEKAAAEKAAAEKAAAERAAEKAAKEKAAEKAAAEKAAAEKAAAERAAKEKAAAEKAAAEKAAREKAAAEKAAKEKAAAAAKAAASATAYEDTVLAPPAKKPAVAEAPKRVERREHVAPVPAPSGSGKMIGIGAAIAVVVIGGGIYFATRKSTPSTPTETTKSEPAPTTTEPTAPAAPAPAAPVLGTLAVEAKDDKGAPIDGADIFVDNQLNSTQVKRGKATLKVSAGKHQIRVEKPGYAAAPGQSVDIAKDATERLQFALSKSAEAVAKPVNPYLMVTSTPGATIKVDNKTIDTVRPDGTYSFQVDPGKHNVEISLRGYKPFTTSVNAKVGDRLPVDGKLAAVPPPTVEFTAASASIQEGQSTELKWNTKDATEVTIDGAPVQPSGTRQVTPRSTTTYTLLAKGEGQPTQQVLTITVAAIPKPAIASFAAAGPTTIQKGEKARLQWSTENATDVSIEGIGKVDVRGSREVSPSDTTSYVLTATGRGGTAISQPVRIVVEAPKPAAPAAPAAPDPAALRARDVADIKELIEQRLKRAYDSMNMAELQKVWPDMPKAVASDTKGLFESDFKNIKMEFKCDPVVNGDAASARCAQTMNYTKGGKAQPPIPLSMTYTLKRVGGAWRLQDAHR